MSTNDDAGKTRGVGWGFLVYQQIASVIGAFALAAFVSYLVDLNWHGLLALAMGGWNEVVRPAVGLLFELSVTRPIKAWLGIDIEVPLLVRDYVSVGAVLFASAVRVDIWVKGHSLIGIAEAIERGEIQEPYDRWKRNEGEKTLLERLGYREVGVHEGQYTNRIGYVRYLLICLVAWPYVIATTLWLLVSRSDLGFVGEAERSLRTAWLLTLSPIAYFAILTVTNFFISPIG